MKNDNVYLVEKSIGKKCLYISSALSKGNAMILHRRADGPFPGFAFSFAAAGRVHPYIAVPVERSYVILNLEVASPVE